jgi:hypothetical protein
MTSPSTNWQELDALLDRLFDGIHNEDDLRRINAILRADIEACRRYVSYVELHGRLAWGDGLGPDIALGKIGRGRTEIQSPQSELPAVGLADAEIRNLPVAAPVPSFVSLQSPLGSFLFSYAAATVIVGVGILIAWMCHVPDARLDQRAIAGLRPSAPGRKPDAPESPEHQVVSVARVTDMVDVAWADPTLAPSMRRILLGDKFALASGLMEITYDTGPVVVLQGPCVYTAESKMGGYLGRGRLMARVGKESGRRGEGESGRLADRGAAANSISRISNPKSSSDKSPPLPLSPSSPLFSVRTPHAVVNDLGTEFGVEVDAGNGSCVHVFAGTVDFVPASNPAGGVRMAAGEARGISAARGAAVRTIALDREAFAKPRAMLAGTLPRDAILFHDAFDTFSLGTRWRATKKGAPDIAFRAVSDGGRAALWMHANPSKINFVPRWIETVEAFPLGGLASLQVDVLFRTHEAAPPAFEVWVWGSSKKMVRAYFQPHLGHRICFDAHDLSNPKHFLTSVSWLAGDRSPNEAYQDGERYRYRSVLSVSRQGADLVVRDDVNLAVVYRASLDTFTLADLGETTRVLLRMLTPQDRPGDCWVYDVTVCGRSSAVHYPPPKDATRHTSPSVPVKPLAVSP